ncbi:hypothetical protein GCM10022206_62000 [Streptomyces chiangmaiensis]
MTGHVPTHDTDNGRDMDEAEDIGGFAAVVGMAARVPGAGDIDGLWEILVRGDEPVTRYPADPGTGRTPALTRLTAPPTPLGVAQVRSDASPAPPVGHGRSSRVCALAGVRASAETSAVVCRLALGGLLWRVRVARRRTLRSCRTTGRACRRSRR